MPLFLERSIALATQDFEAARSEKGPVFFDRGLVDLIIAYEHYTGSRKFHEKLLKARYAPTVYFTPPWPEIYVKDPERQHSLKDAILEYKRLEVGYPKFGYKIHVLPKTSVENRAKTITKNLQ